MASPSDLYSDGVDGPVLGTKNEFIEFSDMIIGRSASHTSIFATSSLTCDEWVDISETTSLISTDDMYLIGDLLIFDISMISSKFSSLFSFIDRSRCVGCLCERLDLTSVLCSLSFYHAHSILVGIDTFWLCSLIFLTLCPCVVIDIFRLWFPNYTVHGFLGRLSIIVIQIVRFLGFPGRVSFDIIYLVWSLHEGLSGR